MVEARRVKMTRRLARARRQASFTEPELRADLVTWCDALYAAFR
jgi:hypothetical protein